MRSTEEENIEVAIKYLLEKKQISPGTILVVVDGTVLRGADLEEADFYADCNRGLIKDGETATAFTVIE